MSGRFYIDCEFDGHGGPLLSIAIVSEDGRGAHFRTTDTAHDPWVAANVMPLMDDHVADVHATMPVHYIGGALRSFIGTGDQPTVIADSPVDIGRFCAALSTGDDGGWASVDYPLMRFEVHNVDCYPTDLPGAVQHNAWWDAMALRHKLIAAARTAVPELLADREAMVARMASATEAFESIKEFADSGENFLCWKVADDALAALKEQS